MKHLSASQNLGYPIQVVQFENIFYFYDNEWKNTYDYFEQRFKNNRTGHWRDFIKAGQFSNLIDGKQVPTRSKSMKILEKSIELEGMQYPIPIMMNDSEKRLEFWSGMRRIQYAMIYDYTSIDAIVLKDKEELYNLQVKLFELSDKHFSKISEYKYSHHNHPSWLKSSNQK